MKERGCPRGKSGPDHGVLAGHGKDSVCDAERSWEPVRVLGRGLTYMWIVIEMSLLLWVSEKKTRGD